MRASNSALGGVIFATAVAIGAAPPAFGQCELAKLIASDAAVDDRFGSSVSIDGDWAVVGAPQDDDRGPNSGAAYVFRRDHNGTPTDPTDDTWAEHTKLLGSDTAFGDRFGSAVSISGNWIVAGAPFDSDNAPCAGSAYVFVLAADTWVQTQKLHASDPSTYDNFGSAVSIRSDRIVVGAWRDDDYGSDSGCAYVFQRHTNYWQEEAKLTASDGAEDDRFGWSVSVGADGRVVAGAQGHFNGDDSNGAAYVFHPDGDSWTEEAKLAVSGGRLFGWAVAIDADRVVVGDRGDDEGESDAGAAHAFRREDSAWLYEGKLMASDPSRSDRLGSSVGIDDGLIIVGAPDKPSTQGAAYVYRWDGAIWTEVFKLVAHDSENSATYGRSVALGGGLALVGDDDNSGGAYGSGAAYVHLVAGEDTDGDGVLDACDECPGYDDHIDTDGDGVPDGCDPCPLDNPDDSDGDSVCDSDDVCPGYDDTIDSDADGIPDGCDSAICERQKLLASDAPSGVEFGRRVATDAERFIVGVPAHRGAGVYAGAAYIFREQDELWTEEARLVPADVEAFDRFGMGVCISGDLAVVGAPYDDDEGWDAGATYVFRREGATWVQECKLGAADAVSGAHFGTSVWISQYVLVVGAPGDNAAGPESGAAYVFRYDGLEWVQEAKLVGKDTASDDHLGSAVAVFSEVVVVGAPGDDYSGYDSGSAYVFRREESDWIQEGHLAASDGDYDDSFGAAVCVEGDRIVVGAPDYDIGPYEAGAAYVYRRKDTGWTEEATLVAWSSPGWDHFGRSVSISGKRVAVGSPNENAFGANAGAVYIFHRDESDWWQEAVLSPSDANAQDEFGIVALNGQTLVVGAVGSDDAGSRTGSVYVYLVDDDDTDTDGDGVPDLCDECPGYDDNEDEDGDGVPDGCDICPGYDDNIDTDDDGVPDGCDICPGYDDNIDTDEDGVPDGCDICPGYDDNEDEDGDGVPDGCDICPGHDDNIDTDEDGVPDGCDICPGYDDNIDSDEDGVPDGCDICPGYDDNIDSDEDGVPDGCDECPGYDDNIDTDNDGVADGCDELVPCELEKLVAPDASENDHFGYCVSASGDRILIGAPDDDEAGFGAGSAYVYRCEGLAWVEEAKLTAADAMPGDSFARSVCISGDLIVIGADEDDHPLGGPILSPVAHNAGSAYVFRREGNDWVQEAKLIAADFATGDWFGHAVAIDGEVVVVGALFDDDDGENSGSAYVFRREGTTWVQEAKLVADDGEAGDVFGHGVAIRGDLIVIGAEDDDLDGRDRVPIPLGSTLVDAGSAYVFRYEDAAWVQETKLIASDPGAYDHFGVRAAIGEDRIVVGAYGDDHVAHDAGSAYVFRCEGIEWVEEAKLTAPDAGEHDEFGVSPAMIGNLVLVGARRHEHDGVDDAGSAYLFRHDGTSWIHEAELIPPNPIYWQWFGWSVTLTAEAAIVGSPFDDGPEYHSGAAYVFALAGEDCNGNGTFDSCDIANGTSEDSNNNGVPDECECLGDLDADGDTDQADLGVLLADWGCDDPDHGCAGDLNGDNETNAADLLILLHDWGCVPP